MILVGDCVDVMRTLDPDSVDAIVTDPPYGLEFMGVAWDTMRDDGTPRARNEWGDFGSREHARTADETARISRNKGMALQRFSAAWAAEALRVAKPGAYLLAFGGTRTFHRLACAVEDAGWEIRDTLMWGYASGFPKSRALLKPAWEPIVMARKPGPLRMLRIDECRIPLSEDEGLDAREGEPTADTRYTAEGGTDIAAKPGKRIIRAPKSDPRNRNGVVGSDLGISSASVEAFQEAQRLSTERMVSMGRWPANIVLTDSVIEEPYSRFFLVPKASRSDREPTGASKSVPRRNTHPTVKPTRLMQHLIRLVTPEGGTVLDPFLGSGTTAKACEIEGVEWIGIERDEGYAAIAAERVEAEIRSRPATVQTSLWGAE